MAIIQTFVGLVCLSAAAVAWPYNPSVALLDPSSNGSFYYFFQFSSSTSSVTISTLNVTAPLNNKKLPLKSLSGLPSEFGTSAAAAYVPAVQDDGSVVVFTGDCTKGSSGSALWRLSGGSWNKLDTSPSTATAFTNRGPSANFGTSAIAFSSTSDATTSELFVFGGMCPRSASTLESWQSNADYSNEMLTFAPSDNSSSAYTVGMMGTQNSLVQEAGYSLTALSPSYSISGASRRGVAHQRTKQQNYVMLGGNTQNAFVNMSSAALFSLPQENWAIIPIDSKNVTVTPRSGHTSVLTPDGSKIIVFGGWVGDVNTPAEPQLLVLDVGSGYGGKGDWTWNKPDQSSMEVGPGIWGHAAVMVGDDVMLITGGYKIPSAGNSRERLVRRDASEESTQTLFYNVTSSSFVDTFTPSTARTSVAGSSPSDGDSTANTYRQIALGTGLAFGLAALIGILIILFFCLQHRRRLRREAEEDELDDRVDELDQLGMLASSPVAGGHPHNLHPQGYVPPPPPPQMRERSDRREHEDLMGRSNRTPVYSPTRTMDSPETERTGLLFEIPSPNKGLRRSLHSRGPNGERFSWVEEPWPGGTGNRVVGSSDIHPIDEVEEVESRHSKESHRITSGSKAAPKEAPVAEEPGDASPERPLSSHPTAYRQSPPEIDLPLLDALTPRNHNRNSDPFADPYQIPTFPESSLTARRGERAPLIDLSPPPPALKAVVFPVPEPAELPRAASPTTAARQSREREIQAWVNDWTTASASLLLKGGSPDKQHRRGQSATHLEASSRSASPEKEDEQQRANSNLSERSVRSMMSKFSAATSGTLTPSRSVSQRKPNMLHRNNSQQQAVNLALAIAAGEAKITQPPEARELRVMNPSASTTGSAIRPISKSSGESAYHTAMENEQSPSLSTPRAKGRPISFAALSASGPTLRPTGEVTPTANMSRQRNAQYASLDDRQSRRSIPPVSHQSPPESPTKLKNRSTWLGSVSRRWPFTATRDMAAAGNVPLANPALGAVSAQNNGNSSGESSSGTSSFTRRSEREYLASGPLGHNKNGQLPNGDGSGGMMQIGGLWWQRVIGPDGKADWTIVDPPKTGALDPVQGLGRTGSSRYDTIISDLSGSNARPHRASQGQRTGSDEWDVERAAQDRVVQVMFSVPREKLRVVNRADGEVASMSEVSFEEPSTRKSPRPGDVSLVPRDVIDVFRAGPARLEDEDDEDVRAAEVDTEDLPSSPRYAGGSWPLKRKPVPASSSVTSSPRTVIPPASSDPILAYPPIPRPLPTFAGGRSSPVHSSAGSDAGGRNSPGKVEQMARMFEQSNSEAGSAR